MWFGSFGCLCHQPTENTNLKERGIVQVREAVEQPVDTEMAEVPESAAVDTPAAPRTEVPPAERDQQNEQIEIQPEFLEALSPNLRDAAIAAQEQERQRTANAAADTSGAADDAQGEALQNQGHLIISVTGRVFDYRSLQIRRRGIHALQLWRCALYCLSGHISIVIQMPSTDCLSESYYKNECSKF